MKKVFQYIRQFFTAEQVSDQEIIRAYRREMRYHRASPYTAENVLQYLRINQLIKK